MSVKTVYLVVSATGEVRVNSRPRIREGEVAFPIKLHFPDGWGRIQAQAIDITVPDPPTVLDTEVRDEREQP